MGLIADLLAALGVPLHHRSGAKDTCAHSTVPLFPPLVVQALNHPPLRAGG